MIYDLPNPTSGVHLATADSPGNPTRLAGDALHFAARRVSADYLEASPVCPDESAQAKAANRVAASLEYMLAHLNQPMKISTLSAIAGYSESRFFELFKLATGDTPINWLIRVRMQWAAELLRCTQLRIKEIAWQVGYEDQFYFSRLFKSIHGVAPSIYRARRDEVAASSPNQFS